MPDTIETETTVKAPQTPVKSYPSISLSIKIGAISGALEAAVNHPLWAWKVRAQNNLGFTLNPMIIYRGVTTNMCSVATIIAARVTLNDQGLKLIYQTEHPSWYQSTTNGFVAGLGAAPLSSIIELGMTQQQKVKRDQRSDTFVSTYFKLLKNHGLKRGLTGLPNILIRDAVFCSAFLGMAPHLKTSLQSHNYIMNPIAASISAGMLLGLPTSIVAHPFDTVAAIQHANAASPDKKKRSAFHIGKEIINEQGFKGLYRNSFLPRVARIASAITIFVESTEELTKRFNPRG